MDIKAVIFDLDGVIVTTDECHYQAWKKLSDEEGIPFSREINEKLRGVSRMASLEIVLKQAAKNYSDAEKAELADRKNSYYVELIGALTSDAILPGVMRNIDHLKKKGIRVAIGSSSKNTPLILKQVGLSDVFDAVSDGNNISHSKPDPEVFVKAAEMLGIPYNQCLVVEDADAGIEAGKAAGMKTLAVNQAQGGDYHYESLNDIDIASIL